VPLDATGLGHAADTIEALRRDGPVLVTCALGFGRSAAAIVAWLVRSGRAADTSQALALIRGARPRIALDTTALARTLAKIAVPAPLASRETP
jgi:protein-tyrosine phosphatase